ncbi:LeuA family protein [Plectonema radiosum NIES-515]|uniref:2-isopropylmalate synthase n=1 Tax=Plectonema radiosum NIES-515 TaxID=2986073 RepID=A0ABT3AX66_9CYAN|nr:LeuA family protein [Plectonema radiosum]MCV3213716.1 LeuA family protein [Plectonema radiosum NIES-515]
MSATDLIYDWNQELLTLPKALQICDDTLRDGLQGGVARMPSVEEKLKLLSKADALGVSTAVVGFPAQAVAYQEALAICEGAQQLGLQLHLGLLGRMVEADIEAIARIQQASGHPVVAYLFVGASPIRRYVETRDVDELEHLTRYGVSLATRLGVPVQFAIEDTARTEPEVVERLFLAAVETGAKALCLCDTVGCLTPTGTERLVKHFRRFIDGQGFEVRLDFHGHNDRGLGVANALAATKAGIDCLECTVFGIGERAGNIPLDVTLVNLKLQGLWQGDLSGLSDYCHEVARVCHLAIPAHYPVFGANAFLTQAGIHASAILKAESRGELDIAALVYCGVDPRLVGLDYGIRVGPYSGRSNVAFILARQGLQVTEQVINQILEKARIENRVLADEEVYNLAQNLIASQIIGDK